MPRLPLSIAASVRTIVRSQSFYQAERTAVGIPLGTAGGLLIIGGLWIWGYAFGFSIIGAAACLSAFAAGLLCFGLNALASAVFDIADCHLRREARTLTAESAPPPQNENPGR